MSLKEKAIEKHRNGYNCAQAVACTFAGEIGVDESLLYRATEGFGAGMGTTEGVCGALSGACVIVGMKQSNGDIENAGQTKAKSTRRAGEVQRAFREKVGEIYCNRIKTCSGTSCSDCIRIATEILEEELKK